MKVNDSYIWDDIANCHRKDVFSFVQIFDIKGCVHNNRIYTPFGEFYEFLKLVPIDSFEKILKIEQ